MKKYWQNLSLVARIRLLRYVVPLLLIPLVVGYQLLIAFRVEEAYGDFFHYASEISFYALAGPVVTWLILVWVERRLKEKEALEQEVRLRTEELAALMAASPDAILSLDTERNILSWNRGAEQLFGFTRKEMLGRPIRTLLPEADRLLESNGGLLQDAAVETTAYNQHGLPLRVDLTQALLDDGQGDRMVRLLILRDITLRSERAAVLEEERSRIARDLHDGLAQNLYFLALKADMARSHMAESPAEAGDGLAEIGRQARQAIREVRRAIFGLKPIHWEPGAFLQALETFVSDFGREANFQTSFRSNVPPQRIPPRLEPMVFRLVQESLNNVAKHAQAVHVVVEIAADAPAKNLLLQISDDGVGFVPETSSRGFGLDQMEARVANLKGEINIKSEPGKGTVVSARLPLRTEGDQNG